MSANPLHVLCILTAFLSIYLPCSTTATKSTYIVYMDPAHQPLHHPTSLDWFSAHLTSLHIDPDHHLLYSYANTIHGFAAVLSPDHLSALESHPAVLDVLPDTRFTLHTTRSPQFLGLNAGKARPIDAAEASSHDVIVAVLDTGIWPESPSFSSPEGLASMPPVPARWQGVCEAGVDFSPSLCNRKLIGARSFSRGFGAAEAARSEGAPEPKLKEFDSVRDRDGHGTHTASTAVGFPVANSSLFGYAVGTARGMAPAARVAAYKVCWASGCYASDILAGMEAAIADGADVLSLSLGGGATPYFRDAMAVGAFVAAAERGIFVSCSAGNSGPGASTLANTAPWIATVGAGTLDRDFPATVRLASGVKYTGVSLYSGRGMGKRMVAIVYGGGKTNASKLCLAGTLDPSVGKGKLVFCDRGVSARVEKGVVVKAAGGVGMILANTAANGEELVADSHLLPALAIGKKAGDSIRKYLLSGAKLKGVLSFDGTVLGVRPSPIVAAFSSRGPNVVVPQILKPDMIGPGVNILAAWSGSAGPTGLAKDTRTTQFNILSGTSMSCPHISGLAALLKSAHPDWSPAAVKSALMTTAYTVDNTHSPLRDAAGGSHANPFAYGAGHVDPERALSPGLIYDITGDDYISFLCSLGYSIPHLRVVVKRPNVTCSTKLTKPGDLNYPSFSVVFEKSRKTVKYRRELTNVGATPSVYEVKVVGPKNVGVVVKPTKLRFSHVGQKLKFSVTFVSKEKSRSLTDADFGFLTWSSNLHKVQSPIVYTWKM